jgi:hypothetical protein
MVLVSGWFLKRGIDKTDKNDLLNDAKLEK